MDQKSDEELVNLKQRITFLELRVKELEEKLQNSFTQYPSIYPMPYYPPMGPPVYPTCYPQNTSEEAPVFLTGMSNGEITHYIN